MSYDLNNVKNEVLDFMKKGKYLKPSKLLFAVFKSISQTQILDFGDLLVELSRAYPDLFTEKIYLAFQFQARKSIPQEILYTLDKYIVEKYCILEDENVTDFFYGAVMDKYNQLYGRIFVTNLRVIASGYAHPVSKSIGPSTGLWSMRRELIHIAVGRAIRRSLNKEMKEAEIINYGYYYPIYNAYKIKKGKSSVSYNVDIEYERKGKQKVEKLSISLTPGQKKENPAYHIELLNKIEALLIKNQ